MSTNHDDHDTAPPVAVVDTGDHGEGGKVKMIVSLVKKCLGVKDIASMRLSLPASLLEPVPNLEYSQPLDRPDLFAAINDSEDPFERMLSVLRFAFAKDLKHVHGKVCKPYNSVLGEHFRAHWDVVPLEESDGVVRKSISGRESGSIRSGSFKSSSTGSSESIKQASTAPTSPEPTQGASRIRVVYLTEQVSHHPPVSTYYAVCPARHIELRGIDQISAKVSGTTLRITAGQHNQGLFIHLTGGPGEGEEYHLTNQTGNVNGILRGNFYITMSDSIIVSCKNDHPSSKHGGIPRFRAIIEYKEESWLGRAHFLIEGVIFVVHDGETEHESWTKVKQVPHNRIAAIIDGTWKGHIRWKRVGVLSYPHTTSSVASSPNPSHVQLDRPPIPSASASKAEILSPNPDDWQTLIDVSELQAVPKEVRPLEKQEPFESRKLWRNVTDKLLNKEYSDATKEKVAIEQKQRDDAAERKRTGVEFSPAYFEKSLEKGYSELTEAGRKAIEEELAEPSPFALETGKSTTAQ